MQDGVDTSAQADLLTNADTVDGIELNVVLSDEALYLAGQSLIELLSIPAAVEQEGTALLQILYHIVLVDVGRIVAGHKVSLADEISGLDGLVTKTQVGNGYAAGFLGVISKITLGVHVGVVTDNLNGVLVGAYGTVSTQAPELTGVRSRRSGIRILFHGEGQVGHIVLNTDGETLLAVFVVHIAVNGDELAGVDVLGTQAVTAGVYRDGTELRTGQGGDDIQI